MRVFADMYPKDVIGMVLVDPSQEAFNDWTKSNLRDLRKEEEARIAKASEGVRGESESLETSYSQARAAKLPAGIPVILISAAQDEGMPLKPERCGFKSTRNGSQPCLALNTSSPRRVAISSRLRTRLW